MSLTIDPAAVECARIGAAAIPNNTTRPMPDGLTSYLATTDPEVRLRIVTAPSVRPGVLYSFACPERDAGRGAWISNPIDGRRLAVVTVSRRTAKALREAHAAAWRELAADLAADPHALDALLDTVPGGCTV